MWGGRLWDVKFQGRSLLFKNPDLIEKPFELDALSRLPTRSPQFGFPLWGGEKTWVAPDSDWKNGAPYSVLDSASYQVISADDLHVRMQSAICPDSGLRIERRITISVNGTWRIEHTVTNCIPTDRYAGIWSVLMLNQPARIGLDSGPTANLLPVFGNADGLASIHGSFSVFDCERSQEFKLGSHNQTGRVLARLDHNEGPLWLSCKSTQHVASDEYAHGHNFEVFNSGDYPYCEAEWHAPARTLRQGEHLNFVQEFRVQTESDLLQYLEDSPRELELYLCMS